MRYLPNRSGAAQQPAARRLSARWACGVVAVTVALGGAVAASHSAVESDSTSVAYASGVMDPEALFSRVDFLSYTYLSCKDLRFGTNELTSGSAQQASASASTTSMAADADADAQDRTRSAGAVQTLLQLPILPAGCESASLTCVLNSMGFDVEVTDIVDDYLPIDSTFTDFVNSFGGDPYSSGGAFAPAIVTAANNYLSAQGETDLQAVDITGASFDELLANVQEARPVIVWSTMYMADPYFTDVTYDGYQWYANEHCVVLYGVDGDEVLVSDPLEGLVKRDLSEFQRIYEACGQMAVVFSDAQ